VEYFFRGRGEETTRNASGFIILFPVNMYLCFLKEASKSSPLFV
jgi:hypothetical protein